MRVLESEEIDEAPGTRTILTRQLHAIRLKPNNMSSEALKE